MKKSLIFTLLLVVGIATIASADLGSFLSSLNAQAQADLPGFKLKISTQFGIPLPRVDAIFSQVKVPADTFMTFQLSEMSRQKPETVVRTYQAHKGKGWGAIAKELGIKPGSPEFHALKSGDLHFTGHPSGSTDGDWGRGKGKGKGRGHNK